MFVNFIIMKPLKEGVWVQSKHQRFFQRIIYEDLPKLCYLCGCVGHAAASCISTADVEPHGNTVTQDKGEGKQQYVETKEGEQGGVFNSSNNNMAAPLIRSERGPDACTTSGRKFQEVVRGLGSWSVTD